MHLLFVINLSITANRFRRGTFWFELSRREMLYPICGNLIQLFGKSISYKNLSNFQGRIGGNFKNTFLCHTVPLCDEALRVSFAISHIIFNIIMIILLSRCAISYRGLVTALKTSIFSCLLM